MEKNEKKNIVTDEELTNVDGGVGKVKGYKCYLLTDETSCRAHAKDNCHWETIVGITGCNWHK